MKRRRVGVSTTQAKVFIKETRSAVYNCSRFEVGNKKEMLFLLSGELHGFSEFPQQKLSLPKVLDREP